MRIPRLKWQVFFQLSAPFCLVLYQFDGTFFFLASYTTSANSKENVCPNASKRLLCSKFTDSILCFSSRWWRVEMSLKHGQGFFFKTSHKLARFSCFFVVNLVWSLFCEKNIRFVFFKTYQLKRSFLFVEIEKKPFEMTETAQSFKKSISTSH